MSYVKPQDVIAPQDRWELDRVLYDGEEDQWSAAKGTWDGEEALAIRWNGTTDHPLGRPHSHAHPTWFIVPHELVGVVQAVIDLLLENEKKHV